MATVTLVRMFKDLSNKPTRTRQMEYAVKRIEDEITRRAKAAARAMGIRFRW